MAGTRPWAGPAMTPKTESIGRDEHETSAAAIERRKRLALALAPAGPAEPAKVIWSRWMGYH